MCNNALYYGDNLNVLRQYIKDESVNLIYLDPPFNSNTTYNAFFIEKNESKTTSQKAFKDIWRWDQAAEEAYQEVVEVGGKVSQAMQAFRMFLGDDNMLSYLSMMAPRLMELCRVLKPTGSIYLHCDPTASHYLKMLMDAVFNVKNFQNEVIWCYEGRELAKRRWNRKHDVLLFYTKSSQWTFNWHEVMLPLKESSRIALSQHIDEQGRFFILRYKRGGGFAPIEKDTSSETYRQLVPLGVPPRDWFLCDYERKNKRLGYPKQKPEALLERIIKASSNEDDLVLDPFCGCGTTMEVAQRLNRQWIGIDNGPLAINLSKRRLRKAFGDQMIYEIIGECE